MAQGQHVAPPTRAVPPGRFYSAGASSWMRNSYCSKQKRASVMVLDEDYLGFEEILDLLAEDDAPLTSGALYALSGMGTNAVARFRERWLTVDVARRRRIIATLVERA